MGWETVKPKEDLESSYYNRWEIYSLNKREVDDEEQEALYARMKWMLTGDEEYLRLR